MDIAYWRWSWSDGGWLFIVANSFSLVFDLWWPSRLYLSRCACWMGIHTWSATALYSCPAVGIKEERANLLRQVKASSSSNYSSFASSCSLGQYHDIWCWNKYNCWLARPSIHTHRAHTLDGARTLATAENSKEWPVGKKKIKRSRMCTAGQQCALELENFFCPSWKVRQ